MRKMAVVADLPFDVEELRKYALMPVFQFLAEYDIYLDHEIEQKDDPVAALTAVSKFIPSGIWPLLDAAAYTYAKEFIRRNNLEERGKLAPFDRYAGGLYEILAFVLKSAWERGYLLYKFRRFGYLPPPNHSVDPAAVGDKVVSWGDADHQNLATNIEVFLQRAIGILIEPEAIKRPFQIFTDDIYAVIRPFHGDWADAVGKVHGWGILSAKAEHELDEEKLAKIEHTVKTDGVIGSVVIGSQIQGDFISTLNYIATVEDIEVAQALRYLADEVVASDELPEETKVELIQQLKELSRQAALPSKNRSSRGVLKAILASIASGIGLASGLTTVWSTWGETISRFFGLSP